MGTGWSKLDAQIVQALCGLNLHAFAYFCTIIFHGLFPALVRTWAECAAVAHVVGVVLRALVARIGRGYDWTPVGNGLEAMLLPMHTIEVPWLLTGTLVACHHAGK